MGGDRFFLFPIAGGGGFQEGDGAKGPGGWNWGIFFGGGGGLNIFSGPKRPPS